MTQETYRVLNNISIPQGKHCKKYYHVWVVRGPAGPVEEYDVLGYEEAKASVAGAWDAEIIRIQDGRIMQ